MKYDKESIDFLLNHKTTERQYSIVTSYGTRMVQSYDVDIGYAKAFIDSIFKENHVTVIVSDDKPEQILNCYRGNNFKLYITSSKGSSIEFSSGSIVKVINSKQHLSNKVNNRFIKLVVNTVTGLDHTQLITASGTRNVLYVS